MRSNFGRLLISNVLGLAAIVGASFGFASLGLAQGLISGSSSMSLPVPEPAGVAMLVSGVAALAFVVARRRLRSSRPAG